MNIRMLSILSILVTCIFTATAMKRPSDTTKPDFYFFISWDDAWIPGFWLHSERSKKQIALFKSNITAQDLCKNYHIDDLKKAAENLSDINKDLVVRAEYPDAAAQAHKAHRRLAVIQQAINLQENGKCTKMTAAQKPTDNAEK